MSGGGRRSLLGLLAEPPARKIAGLRPDVEGGGSLWSTAISWRDLDVIWGAERDLRIDRWSRFVWPSGSAQQSPGALRFLLLKD